MARFINQRPDLAARQPPRGSLADLLDNKTREELLVLAREQQAALATYKETLARIYQEFDAKIEELSLIRWVSDVLRQAEDLRGLGLGLVEVVISELPADFACLLLTDPEMTRLEPLAVFDRAAESPSIVEEPTPGQCLTLGEGPLGEAVGEGRILLLAPTDHSPPAGQWPEILPPGAASLIALPLIARQQILGAIILCSQSPGAFSEEHARALTILCDHAAAALANARLIDQLGEINERLLASELEAHQAREYLQQVLDTASDLIIISDAEGRVTYANQAAAAFGLERQALVGRPLAPLFLERARAAAMLGLGAALSEELELQAPGGHGFSVLVSTTPLPDTGEVLAIVRDVTRRKALERQLMHAEKLASVGILAAGVAHEIGNPLAAIGGYAQLLDSDDTTPAERREFAGAIAEQTERINRIIRELLDYSRPSQYLGQPVDVNQAIEAVLNMFFTSKRLSQENLSIQRDLARHLPKVSLDRDQLQQVVLNMVINAAQAMAGGGQLTISTREQAGWLRMEFADTGPGVAPDKLSLIFDPFFTTKPPGQGTGLGLSICDRIISAGGGRIEVASALGKGTTFTVLLPPAQAEDQA